MMLTIDNKGLSYYLQLLKSYTNFSMARYFDGEWNLITGRRGLPNRTGGGHLYFPKLRDDLIRSIKEPHLHEHYYYGTSQKIKHINDFMYKYCMSNKIKVTWYDGYIFHQAALTGQLFPLIQAYREREIIFVGPESLRGMEKIIPIKHYVSIIGRDCYMQKDDMVERTLKVASKDSVILVHASLAGKVVVYDLYKSLGTTCTIIDTGSIWNLLCNDKAKMRGWWRKLKDKEPKRFYTLYYSNLGRNPDGTLQNTKHKKS